MNPWLRPSIQQPRWISNTIKFLASPLTNALEYVKVYLDTFNSVYKPETDKNDNNKRKEI